MKSYGIADDRKPESRSAGFTRTPLVHAVETLEYPSMMFLCNADAVIGDRERQMVFTVNEFNIHNPAGTVVVNGVDNQIADNGFKKMRTSVQGTLGF